MVRHAPAKAKALGREAALVDIAQDLLLRHLHTRGLMEHLAFKGGPRYASCTPAQDAKDDEDVHGAHVRSWLRGPRPDREVG